jgi:hypothetical protein
MSLLLVRMLQKLLRDRIGVNALSHKVVSLVAKDADDLGGQRFIEHANDGLAIGPISLRDGARLDVLSRPAAELLDVAEKWLISHDFS